jgi:hypothetical protein
VTSLRQFARALDRLQVQVGRLQFDIFKLIEAEGKPKPPAVPKPRAPRWTGPVDAEERGRRQDAWGRRYVLALELRLDPSKTLFAATYKLGHPCAVSRWLTGQSRSIRPGSALDERIWRAVNEDYAKLESLRAKRHGAVHFANPAA